MNRDSIAETADSASDSSAGDGPARDGPAGNGSARPSSETPPAPREIRELAVQTVQYVHAALGIELDYTGDTLPLVDHHLRGVPIDQAATVALIVSTAGAYFGEVVRRQLGGEWDIDDDEEPVHWRLTLPSQISFAPAGLVASAIAQSDDLDELDTALDAPLSVRPYLEAALGRMSRVTAEEYYSLCGRLDTLEHVQAVLTATLAAARKAGAESL